MLHHNLVRDALPGMRQVEEVFPDRLWGLWAVRLYGAVHRASYPEKESITQVRMMCAVIELRQPHVTPTSHLAIRQQVTDHDIGLSFQVQFGLTGLPVSGNFVDRDAEMTQMGLSLLSPTSRHGRKIHVLHGLDDIGKTQLAIAYARKHQETYSAIL